MAPSRKKAEQLGLDLMHIDHRGIFTRSEIVDAIYENRLRVEPFIRTFSNRTGYPLHIGHITMASHREGLSVEEGSHIEIPPGASARLAVKERLSLSAGMIGRVQVKVDAMRPGYFIHQTIKLDAEFDGTLSVAVMNLWDSAITICEDMEILELEIEGLGKQYELDAEKDEGAQTDARILAVYLGHSVNRSISPTQENFKLPISLRWVRVIRELIAAWFS